MSRKSVSHRYPKQADPYTVGFIIATVALLVLVAAWAFCW